MAQTIAPERLTVRKTFASALAGHPEWETIVEKDRDTILRRIERGCFEVTIKACVRDGVDRLFSDKRFRERYSANCSRVIYNMAPFSSVGSAYLLNGILRGSINTYDVASLDSKDLCPMASVLERNEVETRQNQKVINKVSRAYTCRKCGGKETIPIEYQGRSADEGSNFSIKCVNCEFVWRR